MLTYKCLLLNKLHTHIYLCYIIARKARKARKASEARKARKAR